MSYYFSKKVNASFDEAAAKVTVELKEEGFGILTEIDVEETLKKKLNVDFRRYKILGACNPPYAYRALQAEDKIGTNESFSQILPARVKATIHNAGLFIACLRLLQFQGS